MSDPLTDGDDLSARRSAQALRWTDPANWSPDGNEWTGEGLPPWGTKTRCPVKRNGHQCRKSVIPGGAVCNTHGGAAPQVKRRAKLRLLGLVDPATTVVATVLTTATDPRVRLQAAKLIFEVNGMLGPKGSEITVDMAKQALLERHRAMQSEHVGELEVLEAEVIEDSPAPAPAAERSADVLEDAGD